MENGISLKAVLKQLRGDLGELVKDARDEELTFAVEGIEVELKVAITKSAEAKGGVKVYVIEFGATEAHKTEFTQTIKLKLKPRSRDAASGEGDVKIRRRDKK